MKCSTRSRIALCHVEIVWILLLLFLAVVPMYSQTNIPGLDAFAPSANSNVYSIALQTDGKILVAGAFTAVDGQAHGRIARLHADGSLDASFNPNADSYVNCVAVSGDRKILVAGKFTAIGSETRNHIARLHEDGSLDNVFKPDTDGEITLLAVQLDGKVLVGGMFTVINGQRRNNLARLNADGSLDDTFNPNVNGLVNTLVLQADRKIVIGGWFTSIGVQACNYLARLNSDGSLDSTFNPDLDNAVDSLMLQPNGRIVAGGRFSSVGGQPQNFLARLNTDGRLDSTFIRTKNVTSITSTAPQTDGKILFGARVSGRSTMLNRFNPDGSLDGTFNPDAGTVDVLTVQPDGKIVMGGRFFSANGQPRSRIARLDATEPATQNLDWVGSTIIWQRGGTSPEVWCATFEYTTNSMDWINLGEGSRMAGGWQFTGNPPPPNATLRARGHVTDGGASSWLVENGWGIPWVSYQPKSLTNQASTAARFEVAGIGSEPLSFQWRKDGTNLTENGTLLGSDTRILFISNVLHASAGKYDVVVSNAYGCVTSQVAVLTVMDPAILGEPVSQKVVFGQDVSFSVIVGGTSSPACQWRKGNVPITGSTNASLTISNVQLSNVGNYDVVVSNAFGSVTSQVAELSVNLAQPDTFAPDLNSLANSLAVQPDGKVLLAGDLTVINGQPQYFLARLYADGSSDDTFLANLYYSGNCLAIQENGLILAGGSSMDPLQSTLNRIFRLYPDASLDNTFNPEANNLISSLALQADGKLLAIGYFTNIAGQNRNYIARFNTNGSLDNTFIPNANSNVQSLAIQPDGKVLIGGWFTSIGGLACSGMARLNTNGSVDSTFHAQISGLVYCMAIQPDGKIIVGGYRLATNGQWYCYLNRLHIDGSIDSSFNFSYNNGLNSVALQANGKILVAGGFTLVNGQKRNRIARLNADGSLDSTFNPDSDGPIYAIAIQNDGKVLVSGAIKAGWINPENAATSVMMVRLNATEPATQRLTWDGATITWLRGGTAPEVWRTSFAYSTNGVDWVNIGAGSRIAGGWRMITKHRPANARLRARGHIVSGNQSGSSWFVETIVQPPQIVSQPELQAVRPGQVAQFQVHADGTFPLNYCWTRNGVKLPGATNATYTITNATIAQAGSYRVIITNILGSITSVPVVLQIDTAQPTITVITPLPNARVSNTFVTITGHSMDRGGPLASVNYQVNEGTWQRAAGTTNWQAVVNDLIPNTNTIHIYAADMAGNHSLTNTLNVNYVLSDRLQVQTVGMGTVLPNLNSNLLAIGYTYSMKAIPRVGFIFSNWLANGIVATNNPSLVFTMRSNLTLTANFVTNPFVALKGDYKGIFLPLPNQTNASGSLDVNVTNSGLVLLTLTDRGSFSGQAHYRGAIFPFTGTLDANRSNSIYIVRSGKLPLRLSLQFVDARSYQVIGTINEDAAWQSRLTLRYRMPAPAGVFSGSYTLAGGAGRGLGFTNQVGMAASFSVAASGKVSLSGGLADGSTLTIPPAVALTNGQWAVYQSLYGGQGILIGMVDCRDITNANPNSILWWQKNAFPPTSPYGKYYPTGFQTEMVPQLRRYYTPTVGRNATGWTNGVLNLMGGNLSNDVQFPITVHNNVIKVPSDMNNPLSPISILLNQANGQFSGSFIHPSTRRPTTFKGALLQEDVTNNVPAGSFWQGYFLGTNDLGTITTSN
ncbi:MAG: immunoglobulin domain-containing protein [Verrucomicrobiota bacterium]